MSVLWDTTRLKGTNDIMMPGDTITDILERRDSPWTAVDDA